jgi:hypothetical protein
MELQQNEIRECELTAEELDGASGGMRNNETDAWKFFAVGIAVGRIMAGGTLNCV